MGGLKPAATLLARFILCFALIACLWIVSISYRIGPFDYQGDAIVFNGGGAFADSDWLFLAAALALLAGLFGLYRSGRSSAVLMVLASLLILTAIDHVWGVYGAVDEHKGVPDYAPRPALAAVLLCPLAFLFPARPEASDKLLAICWAAPILTIMLIGFRATGRHIFHLQDMIGPSYMQIVLPCLLAPEILRQARRSQPAYGVDRLAD